MRKFFKYENYRTYSTRIIHWVFMTSYTYRIIMKVNESSLDIYNLFIDIKI